MKTQIRRGIFETNSSSEHSLTVMNRDKFTQWKEGKLLARVINTQETSVSYGNFWSYMYTLEFTDDFNMAKKYNQRLLEDIRNDGISEQEEYKNECLNYKKKIIRKLTEDELNSLSISEQNKYDDDLYMDEIHTFNEGNYNYWINRYKSLTIDNVSGLMSYGFWMTYDQFWKDYIKENDCDSPFEHDNETLGIHVIGKYYHS